MTFPKQIVTISVDDECNADLFWTNIADEVSHCPVPRFARWIATRRRLDRPIELDADDAAVVTSWLTELPGWSDPEYPSYAPHPLIVD